MPLDVSKLISDPDFQKLSPDRKRAILQSAGVSDIPATATVTPTAIPTAAPTPGGLVPIGATTPPSPLKVGLNPALDPARWMLTKGLTKDTERRLGQLKEDVQDVLTPVLGTTGAAAAPSVIPSSVPEIESLMAIGTQPESLALRYALPPAVAMGSSYLSGSRVDPLTAGFASIPATILGGAANVGSKVLKGRVASPALEAQAAADLAGVSRTLSSEMPEIMPKYQMSHPSQFTAWFSKHPKDIWGHYLREAEIADARASSIERSVNSYADARIEAAENTPPQLKEANIKIIETNRKNGLSYAKRFREQADELRAQFDRRAKPFTALSDFFKLENFKGGYKKLMLSGPDFQDYLGDPKNMRMWREAGIPQSAIDGMREQMFGAAPGTAPEKVMTEIDIPAERFFPGMRAYQHGGPPSFGMHWNLPFPAEMAGARQAAVTPAQALDTIVRMIMTRGMFGVAEVGLPPEQPTPDNTSMPSGPTGVAR